MLWSLLDAPDPRLAAAVLFGGQLLKGTDLAGTKAAAMVIYAEKSPRNAGRPMVEAALLSAGLKHEVKLFLGADDGFFDETSPHFKSAVRRGGVQRRPRLVRPLPGLRGVRFRARSGRTDPMPTALLIVVLGLSLIAVKCSCLALTRIRPLAKRARVVSHRCRARPVWSVLRGTSFILDAMVETCDDPAVPRGTPFSLRLVAPDHRHYIFSHLQVSIGRGHSLSVELEEGSNSRTARLCAQGWAQVLDVESTTGWPHLSSRD